MGNSPYPALDILPPQGPLDIALKAGNVRAQAQEAQMRTIALVEAARQARDKEIYRQAYIQSPHDADAAADLGLENGGSVEGAQDLRTKHLEMLTKAASLSKTTLENNLAQNNVLQGVLDSVRNEPDASKRPLALAAQIPALKAQGIDPQHIALILSQPLDDESLKNHEALLVGDAAYQKQALEKKNADSAAMTAAARKTEAATNQSKFVQSDEALSALVAQGPSTPGYVNAKLTLDFRNAQKAQTAGQVAGTEAKAKLPYEVEARRQAAAAAVEAQSKLYAGNSALAKVPPHLVAPATADATKVAQEFADATSAADDMKTFVDLARGGNKVAYAYSPTEGVLTLNTARGVKRVNMAEIQSYGGAGSAFDRVSAFLGKQATGASIPDNVLKDMEALHGAIADNAQTKYANKLKGINQNYGSNFQPVQMDSAGRAASLPNGGGKVIDKATAKQFYDAAGHDPDKARQLAIQNGWKIQ